MVDGGGGGGEGWMVDGGWWMVDGRYKEVVGRRGGGARLQDGYGWKGYCQNGIRFVLGETRHQDESQTCKMSLRKELSAIVTQEVSPPRDLFPFQALRPPHRLLLRPLSPSAAPLSA